MTRSGAGEPQAGFGGQSLAGRRALITGGARGIGRSIALALAGEGANVAVAARTADALQAVAAEVQETGRRGVGLRCDVTRPDQVEELARRAVSELDGVDILVNSAGGSGSHKLLGHPDELWHRLLEVNLTSTYYVTKAVLPTMVSQRWGRIINIASVAARTGERYISAYTAAKHGVLGLTRSLAREVVSDGVTVNAVCPGYVNTPMTDANVANIAKQTNMTPEQARHALENTSPQRRLIEPAEVAYVTAFLAMDIAGGITGQAITLDGGGLIC